MITGLLKYMDEVYGAWLRLKALTNCEDYYLNELAEEAETRNITILELINEKIVQYIKTGNQKNKLGGKKWIMKNWLILLGKMHRLIKQSKKF